MKKIFLTAAMVLGIFAFSNAQVTQDSVNNNKLAEVATANPTDDGYKEVKLEQLTPQVQQAIKTNYTAFEIKAVAYHETKKLTKVTLVSKDNGSEKVVVLNEEGKEAANK